MKIHVVASWRMRAAVAGLVVAGVAMVCREASARPQSQPNVVIINVDNFDKWSLGYYGNRFIDTPNIDRLFEQGVRFESYRISGRCTSSRAALMTGRYHARTGAIGTGAAWGYMKEDLPTMGHVFSQNGYRTAMFGKWHLGDTYPLRPEDRGFEEVVTIHNGSTLAHVVVKKGYNGSPRTADAYRFRHNGTWQMYEGFRTDTWFRELNGYLTRTRDNARPFFAYIATVTAHGPHFGPKDLQDKYRARYAQDEWKDLRDRYAAKSAKTRKKSGHAASFPYDHAADIESLDRNVGRLMRTLDELGLAGSTVVVFMSDGSGSGPASVSSKGQRAEFTASSTPMVVRLPASITAPKMERTELVANIDCLPTLAEICGITLETGLREQIDGRSFATLLGVPGATRWSERTYISDHQSSAGKDDLSKLLGTPRTMLLRPFASCQVFLPDGQRVGWRSQKPDARASADVVSTAKAAYEQWLQHVIEDFPLGAFARAGDADVPVYLDGYLILDGPAGRGAKDYFLLDVAADGVYEISTDTGDRYGARPTGDKGATTVVLSMSVQTTPGALPVGFDAKLNGYRVLPETLRERFRTTTHEMSLPATMTLKRGRYLLSADTPAGKSVRGLRVAGRQHTAHMENRFDDK